MPDDPKIHNIIGIAGAARSGKDTLCRSLMRVLKNTYNLESIRTSIAGDKVKEDLKDLLEKNIQMNSFTENNKEKELLRPLLIEYGKLMRNKTDGRYFIDSFKKIKNKINIIPDIRYVEYPKDEMYWLKNEAKGFLIFIERKNVFDANETEKINNNIIKKLADYHLQWDNLNENLDCERKILDFYALEILKKFFTIFQ